MGAIGYGVKVSSERVAHLLRDKTIQRSNLRENAHLADGTVNQYGVRKTGVGCARV